MLTKERSMMIGNFEMAEIYKFSDNGGTRKLFSLQVNNSHGFLPSELRNVESDVREVEVNPLSADLYSLGEILHFLPRDGEPIKFKVIDDLLDALDYQNLGNVEQIRKSNDYVELKQKGQGIDLLSTEIIIRIVCTSE